MAQPNPFHDVARHFRDPITWRVRYWDRVSEGLRHLAASSRMHVVLIGSPIVDELTLLSAPPKDDWSAFYPFAILRLWRQLEIAAMARAPTPDAPSGGGSSTLNWPFKWYAIAYHSIADEIPPRHKRCVTLCYTVYVLFAVAMLFNCFVNCFVFAF